MSEACKEQQHEQLHGWIREKEEWRVKFWQENGSKQLGVDFQAVSFLSVSKKIVTIISKYLKDLKAILASPRASPA